MVRPGLSGFKMSGCLGCPETRAEQFLLSGTLLAGLDVRTFWMSGHLDWAPEIPDERGLTVHEHR